MLKLSLSIVVVSALFSSSYCHPTTDYIDVSNHVKSFEAKFEDQPAFVTINDQIQTVLIKNERSDSGFSHKLLLTSIVDGHQKEELSCELSLPAASTTEILSDKAVILGNGKIVVVTKKIMNSENHWIYLISVDPSDCSTQKAVKVEYDSKYMDVLTLIPYHDSYDVLYKYYIYDNSDKLTKNPHRYNDQGQHIELDYALETYPNLFVNFQINTIKPFDASEGYYHTYYDHAKNYIVLKRLNSRFETVKEAQLYGRSMYLSTSQGHVNYCIFDNEKPVCNVLDDNLEVKVTIEIPKLNYPKSKRIEILQVVNMPKQSFVVFAGFENPEDTKTCDFYLQPVNLDGSSVKTLKIGSGPIVGYQGHHSYGSMQGYNTYVSSENDFCFTVFTNNYYKNIDVQNRCVDLNITL